MRISDWSSDVCSSDLRTRAPATERRAPHCYHRGIPHGALICDVICCLSRSSSLARAPHWRRTPRIPTTCSRRSPPMPVLRRKLLQQRPCHRSRHRRSEEHTSELQSLMRISYAVFCLKKKRKYTKNEQTQ